MNRLVSVIIPCFNTENSIGRSIRSVYEQDWDNIELIVVDDGSTDNSKAEIMKWSDLADDRFAFKYLFWRIHYLS